MPEAVQHYRLLPAALPAEERLMRRAYVPTLLLILVLSTVVLIVLGLRGGTRPVILLEISVLLVAYTVYIAVWYPRRMKRRLARCWNSYDLEIGPGYFARRQADLPDLYLSADQIRTVEHVRGRYLRLIGEETGKVITIPEGIEKFDDVLAEVASLRPIKMRRLQQWQKYRLFTAAGIALFITMLWSSSPWLVVALSLAMSATIVWTFLWIRRNANVQPKTKSLAWIYMPFLLVCALKLLVAINDLSASHGPR